MHDIPDKCIDLHALNLIQLPQRLLDLPLVCLDIYDENQRIVLLNLLHRALSIERMNNDLARIEARLMWDRLARIFRCARECEGFWAVEGGVLALFADLVRVDLFCERQAVRMMELL